MSQPVVFLIDDEASVRETFQAILATDGYEFATATNGPEALERLPQKLPDVILLDVMMPAMDGYEVCRRIKADHRLRHLPLVLVTVLDSKDDLVKGLDAGADEFLTKPVSAVELRARVRSMMRIKAQHDRLRATVKMRDDLANMVVHDMRAPVNVIRLHAEWLSGAEACAPEELKKRADAIVAQTERANSFLNDMLLLAKLEAGKLVVSRAIVDMNPFLRSLEADQRELAQSKGITLAFELPEKSRIGMLDPMLLGRVLDNLVSNALKFSPRGQAVRVVATYPDKKGKAAAGLTVEVRDHGPGIPDAEKERIFEKFEIVAQNRPGIAQFGLGLSFARLAVDAHGGRLSVKDNEPNGSVFVVEL